MNRRNFLKRISAATTGLALAPLAVVSPVKEIAVPSWIGTLIPYGLYSDGRNMFLAINKSEITTITNEATEFKMPDKLILVGSAHREM